MIQNTEDDEDEDGVHPEWADDNCRSWFDRCRLPMVSRLLQCRVSLTLGGNIGNLTPPLASELAEYWQKVQLNSRGPTS